MEIYWFIYQYDCIFYKSKKEKVKMMGELLDLFKPILEFGKDGNWKMIVMWLIGGILIYLPTRR